MKYRFPESLQEYVKPTKYCDADSPNIIHKAESLAEYANTPKEAALKVFNFVRDEFLFGFTDINQKASETLNGNQGWCVTKTNLQIALLRALGIPARYHQVAISKVSLKGIIWNSLYKSMDEIIGFHPWCECFIGSNWTACDLFIDKATYESAIHKGLYKKEYFPTIDWDGENDLILVTHWLLEDIGVHKSYDAVVEVEANNMKRLGPSFLLNLAVKISNNHTARLRKSNPGN